MVYEKLSRTWMVAFSACTGWLVQLGRLTVVILDLQLRARNRLTEKSLV